MMDINNCNPIFSHEKNIKFSQCQLILEPECLCVYVESSAPNLVTEQKTGSKNLSVGSFLLQKVGQAD